MHSIVKLRLARKDLIDIWLYTFREWGELQADRYLRDLEKAILGLTEHPTSGVSYEHIRAGYRRLSVNHHRVFYRINGDRIEIIRVLHESMDAARHL